MIKKISTLILAAFLVFTLTAGAAAEANIAIVFATGGLGDQSFNDAAYRGIQEAEEDFGISYDYGEPDSIADYDNFLQQFASTGQYDLIISIGFDQADALSEVSQNYPDQKFALIDATTEGDNIASYVYTEKERGFLMGAAAAMMTQKTDEFEMMNDEYHIGVIGGMEIPLINANIAGFQAGAEYISEEVEVSHSYVGAWDDPGRGKELAISMIEDDADIIWAAAGRSGLGVIEAAEENNIYAIGSDADQSHLAPEHVITNGMKFVDNTVYIAVEQILDDEFEAGVHTLGVEEDALGYTETMLPADVIEKLEEIKSDIIDGEIEIPEEL
ncbi:MAG: BMP family lipoprotein [Bacillota bacterium]